MTLYWPGIALCLFAVAVGVAVWLWLLPVEED